MPLILFLILGAVVAYTIAGYPLLLSWMAARFGKPPLKRFEPKTVSVLIPVHNGEQFLAAKLDSILNLDYPRQLMEILVVSDGSTDSTDEIAKSYANRGVSFLRVPRGGKPAALNAAVALTHGEVLLFTDVRQVLEGPSLKHLVAPLADPSVGVVSGDLIIRSGNLEEKNVSFYWRYERRIRKQLGNLDSMMGATGPFYAIRRELFTPIPDDTLLDDMYVPLGAFFRGYRLIVEETARAFDYPTSIDIEFRRKVRTLAGNYQVLRQYPDLLSFQNRMLFHFVSYKLLRLMLPWLLMLLFAISFWLPWPWSGVAVGSQALFNALALADLLVPPQSSWKRLSSPARTVVTMLAATACAVAIFFVPPRRLWKPTQIPVAPGDCRL